MTNTILKGYSFVKFEIKIKKVVTFQSKVFEGKYLHNFLRLND